MKKCNKQTVGPVFSSELTNAYESMQKYYRHKENLRSIMHKSRVPVKLIEYEQTHKPFNGN